MPEVRRHNCGGASVNLHDAVPNLETTGDYCASRSFWKWEREIAIPAIQAAGFELYSGFRTIEKDSFGPLIRGVDVVRENKVITLWYG
jgi:hypothetical protein